MTFTRRRLFGGCLYFIMWFVANGIVVASVMDVDRAACECELNKMLAKVGQDGNT